MGITLENIAEGIGIAMSIGLVLNGMTAYSRIQKEGQEILSKKWAIEYLTCFKDVVGNLKYFSEN